MIIVKKKDGKINILPESREPDDPFSLFYRKTLKNSTYFLNNSFLTEEAEKFSTEMNR